MAMYQTLAADDTVRFIKLSPSRPHAPISIELVPGNLSTAHGTYEATSYTWGDDQPTTTILCNGEAFELRQSAYDFLCRLRKSDTSRLLWMDCICIDQSDPTERANQVKIMHLIYEHAKTVLVWLGPESNDSALAMEYASQLDSPKYVLEALMDHYGGPAGLHFGDKSYLFDDVSESQENQRLVTALCALVSRSWLLRMWIQQEAAVCPDTRVFCGAHQVLWEQFFSLAWLLIDRTSADWPRWVDVHPAAIQKCLWAARTIQRSRVHYLKIPSPWAVKAHKSPIAWRPNHEERLVIAEAARTGPVVYKGRELLVLLRECSGCQATDPRDKMYALFNLSSCRGLKLATRPEISYTVPWQMLYIRLAKWMYGVVGWGNLMMEAAGRSRQAGPDMPSWVPDWRKLIDISFIQHGNWSAGGVAYPPHLKFISLPRPRPGLGSIPTYSYRTSDHKTKSIPNEAMELTAILLDRIVYTSSRLERQPDFLRKSVEQIKHRVETDLEYVSQHIPTYFTGETGQQAYAATMIANTTHDDKTATRDYERNGLALWRVWLDAGLPDPEPVYQDAVDSSGALIDNPLCSTAHNLICLAPRMAVEGDFIAILAGFKYPVALRKVGSAAQQYYELLGSCYVHRMMQGRAWNLIEEFKRKHRPGSETETADAMSDALPSGTGTGRDEPCESFPFNPKSDYCRVLRVLGKRRIVLV